MSSLQAVAMGLVIVFLDVGPGGWDWVADPLGWVLVLIGLAPLKELLPNHRGVVVTAWLCLVVSVLIFPPDSVDIIDPTLGWLFSVPTIAFCFLLCDALADTPDEHLPPGRGASLRLRFRLLRGTFVLVGLLPLLVYVAGFDWLTIPTAVAAVAANLTLVLSVWAGGDEAQDAEVVDRIAAVRARQQGTTRPARPTPPGRPTPPPPADEGPKHRGRHKKREQGFDAEAVKRRVRRERGA